MNSAQYNELRRRAVTALGRQRINEALGLAREALTGASRRPEFLSALDRLVDTYKYLTAYALDGYPDPTRSEQTAAIGRKLIDLLNLGAREIEVRDSTRLYYSTLRFQRRHPEQTIATLADDCRRAAAYLGKLTFSGDADQGALRAARISLESTERHLFSLIWVTAPLTPDDSDAIRGIFADPTFGDRLKSMVVGALFLGLLELFDPARVLLMIDAYEQCAPAVSVRALTMLPVALTMTDRDALAGSTQLKPRLAALAEDPRWRRDITEVFRQLLTSRDTERITRKMNDEIIPSMRDISRNINDMIRDRSVSGLDPATIEDAEQWQRLLDDAGVADKMREISEIQESGGDIMMTTFGHLKDFPFFREIAHWFMPFDPDHTQVSTSPVAESVAELLASSPLLCDNDKYSMILSLSRVPSEQQEFLSGQIAAQTAQMAEAQASSIDPGDAGRSMAVTGSVRDLYRFFRLSPRAGEFANPFDSSLNLMAVPMIKETIDRDALIRLAADFYFTHGYYADALPMLSDLEGDLAAGEEARHYYRMGVCYRHTGDIDSAITYLERSELFDERHEATLVELGLCYRAAGNHRKAYESFRRADAMHPDGDNGLQLQMVAELIELERYQEALKLLYKLEYLYGLTPAFTRRLATCEMMLGHYDRCREHLAKLDRSTPEDMLCHAAIETAQGNYRTALDRLRSAANMAGGGKDLLLSRFDSLAPVMLSGGCDPSIIAILKDNI